MENFEFTYAIHFEVTDEQWKLLRETEDKMRDYITENGLTITGEGGGMWVGSPFRDIYFITKITIFCSNLEMN